jgi:hypothetical protein
MINLTSVVMLAIGVLFQTPPPPTPTFEPTIQAVEDELQDYLGQVDDQQDNVILSTDGEQIFDENNNPMLPEFMSPAMLTTLSYMKFLLDSSMARAVFGPFAPIVNHIRLFVLLAFAWAVVYFAVSAIKLLIQLVLFLIRYLVPFVG